MWKSERSQNDKNIKEMKNHIGGSLNLMWHKSICSSRVTEVSKMLGKK